MTWRFGLLGASRIAPNAVIAPVKENAAFALSAVAARDIGRAKAYAAEHGIAHVAKGYAALIARDDVDIVYNALPPAAHAEWTIRALEAGKHVLCEKPFARGAGEARAMAAAAEKSGRVLLEAYHYRFHALMEAALEVMRSSALGPLTRAAGQFSVPIARTEGELRWSAAQQGGALMDLGCYPLHALRTLFAAEPTVSSAHATFVDGVDATLEAELRFGAATAAISCSMQPETVAATLSLEGEAGRLDIVNFVAPQLGCRFATTIAGETRNRDISGPTTYAAQLLHLEAVLEGRAAPITGGADAIAQMTAIDAIYAVAGRT